MSWGLTPWGISAFGTGVVSSGGGLILSNISPPSGLVLATTDPVSFDLTAGAASMQIVIAAEYADSGIVELVYDNTVLTPYYRNGFSSVSSITNGKHFSILRTPKWPGALVRIRVFATDTTGDMLDVTLGWDVTVEVFTPTTFTEAIKSAGSRKSFDPLGFGMVRPVRRVSTNDFASASGDALIRAAVGQILGTAIGEVPWRPKFGTRLNKLRHLRNVAALPELAKISIQEALQRWEPRVTIKELTSQRVGVGTENQVLLSLTYQISNSNPQSIQLLI